MLKRNTTIAPALFDCASDANAVSKYIENVAYGNNTDNTIPQTISFESRNSHHFRELRMIAFEFTVPVAN